jgi:hypothetical protein
LSVVNHDPIGRNLDCRNGMRPKLLLDGSK